MLANILLNELDWELERRGHAFVRYADDFIILKRSRKAAECAMESMAAFIEGKLFLKVNREKSFVAHISKDVKYLGYAFYQKDGELRFRVHPKSVASLKDKIRVILARSNGWSFDARRAKLTSLVYGWVGYFRLADMKSLLKEIDEWTRRKIRCAYRKAWKKTQTKYRALRKLGVSHSQAYRWANSRKSYWRVALSYILATTLNNSKLKELGWASFSDRYLQVSC